MAGAALRSRWRGTGGLGRGNEEDARRPRPEGRLVHLRRPAREIGGGYNRPNPVSAHHLRSGDGPGLLSHIQVKLVNQQKAQN